MLSLVTEGLDSESQEALFTAGLSSGEAIAIPLKLKLCLLALNIKARPTVQIQFDCLCDGKAPAFLKNSKTHSAGETLEGIFRINYEFVGANQQPDTTNVRLRLIGKTKIRDPDNQAAFNLTNGAGLRITSNTAHAITGRWTIPRTATANLQPLSGRTIVPIEYEFLATYTGQPRPVRLDRGAFQLSVDRVPLNI